MVGEIAVESTYEIIIIIIITTPRTIKLIIVIMQLIITVIVVIIVIVVVIIIRTSRSVELMSMSTVSLRITEACISSIDDNNYISRCISIFQFGSLKLDEIDDPVIFSMAKTLIWAPSLILSLGCPIIVKRAPQMKSAYQT